MSIFNISCDEVVWGEIFPRISLVQAINVLNDNPYIANNKVPMLEGCFGLTIMSFYNDPFIAFSNEPKIFPGYKFFSKLKDSDVHNKFDYFLKFDDELIGYITELHTLMESIIEDGYTFKEWGKPGIYICDKIAKFIADKKPEAIYKRF